MRNMKKKKKLYYTKLYSNKKLKDNNNNVDSGLTEAEVNKISNNSPLKLANGYGKHLLAK